MWTLKTKVLFLLYQLTGAWLPASRHVKLAGKIRSFWAARIARCGKHVNIERNAYFTPGLTLGDRSGIGIRCEIYGQVTIGRDVMMGPEVVIYTCGHRFDRTDIPMMDQGSTGMNPVTIGNDVWIGRRAIILPGVTISDGCVIGAGAVVTKDIPPYSIAAGVPATVRKSRRRLSEDSGVHMQRKAD